MQNEKQSEKPSSKINHFCTYSTKYITVFYQILSNFSSVFPYRISAEFVPIKSRDVKYCNVIGCIPRVYTRMYSIHNWIMGTVVKNSEKRKCYIFNLLFIAIFPLQYKEGQLLYSKSKCTLYWYFHLFNKLFQC